METLDSLFNEWVTDHRVRSRRGMSVRSERGYRADLAGYVARVPLPDLAGVSGAERLKVVGVEVLEADTMLAVLARLVAEGKAPATRARMLSAWRGLCRYLVRVRKLDADPTAELSSPASSKSLPPTFTLSELSRIFAAAAEDHPRFRALWPVRDVAMLAMLAGAGLRASELIELRRSSIDWEGRRIRVTRGKGGKDRVLPVDQSVLDRVAVWLAQRDVDGLGDDRPEARVFVRTSGEPFNVQALDHLVDRWLQLAGIPPTPGSKAHRFRHAFATLQMDAAASLSEIQALLGHANIATTSIYLELSSAELRETARTAPAVAALRTLGQRRSEQPVEQEGGKLGT